MSRARLAPTLEALLEEPVKGVPMFAAYHGEIAVKELRALLSVARAARVAADDYDEEPYGLHRALARLRRAGGGR